MDKCHVHYSGIQCETRCVKMCHHIKSLARAKPSPTAMYPQVDFLWENTLCCLGSPVQPLSYEVPLGLCMSNTEMSQAQVNDWLVKPVSISDRYRVGAMSGWLNHFSGDRVTYLCSCSLCLCPVDQPTQQLPSILIWIYFLICLSVY